ncbi:hypothetical protein [Cupriavidus necator]
MTYAKVRAEYQKVFRLADVDQDYQLSRHETEERLPRLLADFSRLDANSDGYLSHGEYMGYVQGRYRKPRGAKPHP